MTNPTGELKVKANGKTYRLHLGISVLAELQEEWGDKLDALLSKAEGDKVPDLKVIISVFTAALQRHHADEVDRWLVDDIVAQNQNTLNSLLSAAFPDAEPEPDAGTDAEAGDGGGKKKAAA